ncbi:MAG TPA: Stp1/IreP family PP2C-type Ser/Thr phosphatase [Labilithrix sp.]|nr:Stp1/IreP family PP2C-type Ser/Thr phosphatase [Labilithrix sp.]
MTQPETPVPTPAGSGSASESSGSGTSLEAAPATEVRVHLFARTDVGQVREHNEDNFLVADLTRRSRGLLEANRATVVGPQGAVFAVCDGMGGAAAGEIASQLAVDIIYERLVDGLDERPVGRDELARRLVQAVEAAGLRIFHEAKADRSRRGMGTTVTAAALVDEVLFFAQVGDSRGYILRGDTLVQLTRDQSLVNQLIEAGQLTEEEAETFEHNNIILQALGTSDTVQVDLTFAEVRRGDILLLCSDGLSGMVRFEDIRETLRSGAEPLDICKALTERANQAGGHDNITVIIVQFDGASLKPLGEDGDPLKYQKYVLAEDSADEDKTAPHISKSAMMASGDSTSPMGSAGLAAAQPAGWHEQGPHAPPPDYDRVDIPGTHVPLWMVIGIVAGVVVLLAGTAFLLLR